MWKARHGDVGVDRVDVYDAGLVFADCSELQLAVVLDSVAIVVVHVDATDPLVRDLLLPFATTVPVVCRKLVWKEVVTNLCQNFSRAHPRACARLFRCQW